MKNQEERWKPIRGYEDRYEVSNCGRVRSFVKAGPKPNDERREVPIIVKQTPVKSGHLRVGLRNGRGSVKSKYVHRLVVEAFIGIIPDENIVCHIDDNPSNNHVSNLYIGDRRSNLADALRNNRFTKGGDHFNSSLKADDVIFIRLSKDVIKAKTLACMFDISVEQIYNIRNRKYWAHI
jgi:hypothetical protein